MRMPTVRPLTIVSILALFAACDGRDAPPVDPGPGPNPPPPPLTLAVERVFPNLTFDRPVAMLQAPGDTTRWFVVEQDGVVRVFQNDPAVPSSSVFVDISSLVASPDDGRGGETGLLGMAFHPQFATNGRVFLSYTELFGNLVSRVSEFRTINNGQALDPTPQQILITVTQPQDNHNGGHIAFDPLDDDLLFIGFGDGGGADDNDAGHAAVGNGQFLQTLLGKMLRIDVSPQSGYQVPPDNPFAGNLQCDQTPTNICPEIFAVGFRNPWRWSLDRSTGVLWVGDVGQGSWEEVDRVTLGSNQGWRCREGAHDFNTQCGGATNLSDPIAEYASAGENIAVTGGYVYRGSAIAALQGRYVFGDFGSGRIWHIAGDTQPTLQVTDAGSNTAPVLDTALQISSFAEDAAGELYVVHYGGTLHRIRTP